MQIDRKTKTKQSTQILLIVQQYSTRRRKHTSEPYRQSCRSLKPFTDQTPNRAREKNIHTTRRKESVDNKYFVIGN